MWSSDTRIVTMKSQKKGSTMKAIAVYPGKPHSMHLEDVPMPKITDIPNGQGVLVKVLRVGVDGTDKEINAAEYGMAPEDYNYLITGHENFGQVMEVGPHVPDTIRPGTYVVATVRRPGHSIYDRMRLRGVEVTCYSRRLPPYFNSDLITELGAHYVSSQQATLTKASEMHGPFDIIFEASGFSPLAFQAAEALGKNGVLVLSSVTGGEKKVEVNADKINQGFVLGNKVMVGTVNASRADFVSGVNDLVKAEAFFPGWLNKLLTTKVHGLENYAEMLRHLTQDKEATKVYIEVAQEM